MAYVTSAELQIELESLATGLGISVQELLANYVDNTTYAVDKAAITARLDAIDVVNATDGVTTLAEKIKAIDLLLTDPTNQTLATDLLNRIAVNTADIASEASRAAGVEAQLRTDVDAAAATGVANTAAIAAANTNIANNKAASDAADAALDTRVTVVEGDVATLKGASTVVGSVDYKVEQERLRAVAAEAANAAATAAVDAKVTTLNGDSTVVGSVDKKIADAQATQNAAQATKDAAQDAAIAAAQTGVDANTAAISAADAKIATLNGGVNVAGSVDKKVADAVAAQAATQATKDAAQDAAATGMQAEIDAIELGTGLNSDGTFTPDDGTDALYEYVADVAGDANDLRKAVRKVAKKSKAADVALQANIDAEAARAQASEATLQANIDALSGGAGSSLSALDGRVTTVENDLNDTTDPVTGAVTKGVKTRVTDLEAGLVANQADQDAKDVATNARIDALQGSGLAQGVICGTKAANAFRAVFAMTPLVENCPTATTTTTTTTTGL